LDNLDVRIVIGLVASRLKTFELVAVVLDSVWKFAEDLGVATCLASLIMLQPTIGLVPSMLASV